MPDWIIIVIILLVVLMVNIGIPVIFMYIKGKKK